MASKEARVYEIIEKKAGSNIAMQGLSGLLGFPFTTIADVGVVFTHYGPMLNEIRCVYGRREMSKDTLTPIIKGCSSEILSDMLLDKILGQIPVLGFGTNMLCAKAMTWRLGLLFGMLSARGESINEESVKNCTRLIRELFPQKDSLLFKKPSIVVVEKLLNNLEGNSQQSFDQKVLSMLDSLENM